MQAGLVDLLFLLYRGCAGPARAAANGDGWDEAPPSARAISHNARALAKFGRPKNACVSWAAEFGEARRAEPEEPPKWGDAADTRLLAVGPPGPKFKIQLTLLKHINFE